MTQNNEREAFENLLNQYWNIAYAEGGRGVSQGSKAQEVLSSIRGLFDDRPISQNEQQEAVEALRERDRLGFAVVEVIGKLDEIIEVAEDIEFNDFAHMAIPLELWNELKDALDLMPERADNYTSPPKQIPDGWKPIETVPKDGTQVIIKCSGGRVATAFYDGKPFVGEGWHVVVPCLGGFGSGTDTFIYFQEDMPTHWMPLPAQTTSETNTEVGND